MTYDKTYELKLSDQTLSVLRREVRAARLRLRRNTRIGLDTPRRVVQLAEIDLPPVVKRYHLVRPARPGAGGKAVDIRSHRRQAWSGLGLDQGTEASATETPAGVELDAAGTISNASTDQVQLAPGGPAVQLATPTSVETSEGEHSGNVTLYLPKDLSRWLTDHHDASRISYPEFVVNTIRWATARDRLSEIFPPDSSAIQVNDLFGRPVRFKPVRNLNGTDTRTVRFRQKHMKVIIVLARTWTADNRNAFFVGVLEAYRDREIGHADD